MTYSCLLILPMLGLGPADPPPAGPETAEQFLRVIHALHGELKSVSLIFEGEEQYVGPASLVKGISPDELGERYQFSFAYREDGAAILEGYHETLEFGSSLHYKKFALLKGRSESVDLAPDAAGGRLPVQSRSSSPIALMGERIPPFFLLYFFNSLASPGDLGYEFHGWETLDGQRCLVVSIDKLPRSLNPGVHRLKFWIDVARGGHPLMVETYSGRNLVEKCFDIHLDRYGDPTGPRVWVPVNGKYASYNWDGKFYREPILSGSATAIGGSVEVNKPLEDSAFSVGSRSRLPETAALKRLQARFRSEIDRSKTRRKTDPSSIAAELDRRLEEANRQAEELSASAPSGSWPSGTTALQSAACVAGVACLVVAYRKSVGRGG